MTNVGVRHEVLEQLEGRCIQPLEIVEKHGERMILVGERRQKGSEHHVKAALGLRGWELRNRWLFPNDELQLGDEAHDELTIQANSLPDRVSPTLDL